MTCISVTVQGPTMDCQHGRGLLWSVAQRRNQHELVSQLLHVTALTELLAILDDMNIVCVCVCVCVCVRVCVFVCACACV